LQEKVKLLAVFSVALNLNLYGRKMKQYGLKTIRLDGVYYLFDLQIGQK